MLEERMIGTPLRSASSVAATETMHCLLRGFSCGLQLPQLTPLMGLNPLLIGGGAAVGLLDLQGEC